MKNAMVVVGAALCLAPAAFGYVAIVNKTDHEAVHIVPAPGKVAIDGTLDDWDLSGAIDLFMDDSSRATLSVNGACMYDAQAVYIGGHVKDPTPMVSTHHFAGDMGMVWDGDAIQIRLVSNPDIKSTASLQTGAQMSAADQAYVSHITLWYSTTDARPGFYVCHTLRFKDGQANPPGVEGAYVRDADGKGYTFEYRIPWAVIRAPRPWKDGDVVQTQWQIHWGDTLGEHVKWGMTDVRNRASGDLGYMGPGSWGQGIVHGKGQLQLAKPATVGRAAGHIPIAFTLETDSKVSLAIRDGEGRLIRTCLGAEPFKAGPQTYRWDGLDDFDRPVAAGSYTARLLTHGGIRQRLVCDVGVSGNPPYQTEDGTGGWAGDYNTPLYVAADGDRVVLGTGNGEAAPITICTDLDGNKKYGTAAKGGALALYKGFGYFMQRGNGKLVKFDLATGALSPFKGGKSEMTVLQRGTNEEKTVWDGRSWTGTGLVAVDPSTLVLSIRSVNQLLLIDLETGTVKGEAELALPGGLAVDGKGTLYAVSSNAVGRYDLAERQFTPIAADLDEPKHLACDRDGNVYVSLQGKTMQVWKLSPEGKVLLKIGKAGGRPLVGRYDPSGMLKPYGIAVDTNGRLWVAEADDIGRSYADSEPKRYSVWGPDGSLWKEFFGSMTYSTRAYVDAEDPDHVYAGSVKYSVDYEKGTWKTDSIILRPGEDGGVKFGCPASHAGATFVNVKGRKFLWARHADPGPVLYECVKDAYVPRMAFYSPAKTNWWLDDNNDGRVQPVEIRGGASLPGIWLGHPMDNQLNLYWSEGVLWHAQGGRKTTKPYAIKRWDFLGFNRQGGLQYGDPSNAVPVAADPDGGAVSSYTPDAKGNLYVLVSGGSLKRGAREQGSGHRVTAFGPDGRKRWDYQNAHCAFAWTSDPYKPGALVGAIGFASGTTRDLVAIIGYYGQYFLLDSKDGLFVDALGEDQRNPYTLDQHMVLTENFNGTLFLHKNGKTYFIGGDADCRLWELTGLDTLKRQTVAVAVTPAMIARSEANAAQNHRAEADALGKIPLKVAALTGAGADGNYEEWSAVQPVSILAGTPRSARAQAGYDAKNLYVRFQVADESPFVNTPTDQRLLFKSGDAVEINLAADTGKRNVRGQNQQQMRVGDVRLIVARTADNKVVATCYRYVTAGAEKPNAFSVETKSSGKDTLDEVSPWNDLPVNVKLESGGYVVEVAIPWEALGVVPKSGLNLLGDFGVIYGNEGGNKNAIRYLWSDKSPEVSINNDIPSEIRIHPNDWATLILE
jgi:sugar lactone lactonase YvrE